MIRFHFDPIPIENGFTQNVFRSPEAIRKRLKQSMPRPSSEKGLISFIERGLTIQPIIPYCKNGVRYIRQQVFMFSIEYNKLLPKQALQILRGKGIFALGGYPSFNGKEYVLVLICECEVEDSFERRFIIEYVNHLLLPDSKNLCDDDIFMGTNKKFVIREDYARFKINDIVNIINIAEVFPCVNNMLTELKTILKSAGCGL